MKFSRERPWGAPAGFRVAAHRRARSAVVLAVCLSVAGWAQQPSSSKPEQPAPPESSAGPNSKAAVEQDTKSKLPDPGRQVNDDAARLLELATKLKAEVDRTNKDTLSLKVIRDAETIEKLAKGVRQQLKQGGGAN